MALSGLYDGATGMPFDIVAFSGSLRAASGNTGLLRAARALAPETLSIEIIGLHDVPLFDEDLERDGGSGGSNALRDRVARADAIMLATPEYNYGLSGVQKNAIDWLSRPVMIDGKRGPTPIGGKPVGVVGASAGGAGTARAQLQARTTLALLGCHVMPTPEIFVAGSSAKFDDLGELADDKTRELLEAWLQAFAGYVARHVA
jgi:chromate reductase, NAD(P)H dehydrogenase (quinone)